MIEQTPDGHSLTIRRTIKAARQRVFDAWTQVEHLKNWWRANPNWHTEIAEVDLQVGGKYRLGMRDPEQPGPFVCGGEFVEIVPPEKVVYTWSWETPGMETGVTLVTVQFVDRGASTEVVLTHTRLPSAELATRHNEGWTACIEQLAAIFE